MTRFRRVRWVAITTVAATAVSVLAISAEAYADRSGAWCAPPAHAVTVQQPAGHDAAGHDAAKHDASWRSSAFRAAGCHAWRTIRSHHVVTRSHR
jgi:hypothetical protein